MKPLTCPNCKKKYPLKLYYYQASRLREAEFDCVYCSNKLGFNQRRRFTILLISFAPLLGSTFITKYLADSFEFSLGLSYLIFVVFLLTWSAFMLQFDTFKKVTWSLEWPTSHKSHLAFYLTRYQVVSLSPSPAKRRASARDTQGWGSYLPAGRHGEMARSYT